MDIQKQNSIHRRLYYFKMKITTKILAFFKYILYYCKVYLIILHIDSLEYVSNGIGYLNTQPPYRKMWGGIFYTLYSGCICLNLAKNHIKKIRLLSNKPSWIQNLALDTRTTKTLVIHETRLLMKRYCFNNDYTC